MAVGAAASVPVTITTAARTPAIASEATTVAAALVAFTAAIATAAEVVATTGKLASW